MGKIVNYTALASKVLVVCVDSDEDWAAYCDAVPGINHEQELESVARMGSKISPRLAKVLFPSMDIEKYRL